jgi:hypothetical protein
VTKLSFANAYADQCGGSADDAVKMRTTLQLDDDHLAGQQCLHRNGLPPSQRLTAAALEGPGGPGGPEAGQQPAGRAGLSEQAETGKPL